VKENIMEFNTRSLSAQESRVVLALRERGQREVTRADIVKLLGASLKAADKVIGSLRRKGWLERASLGRVSADTAGAGP
jgi:predicted transcriptional regulator of viral defense system